MSVSGLYDSEIGDQMARKTMVKAWQDDKNPVREYAYAVCACGNLAAVPNIIRNSKKVCVVCAKRIPRLRGGRKASTLCSKCKAVHARIEFVMRKGKLVCKKCDKIKIDR